MSLKEAQINEQLIAAQGKPVDMGGYYKPDESILEKQMRPSNTLNEILESIKS